MSRTSNESFSKSHNPKSRSSHIDYDYLGKLSESELAYLAKFSDEYYGAAFDTNPAYMLTKDLLEVIDYKINTVKGDKRVKRWVDHKNRVAKYTKKFIQVSNNENKAHNIDLRSCRSHNVWYKAPEGYYTTSERFKYSDKNINDLNDKEVRAECNERSVGQNRCVLGMFGASPIENDDIMDYAETILGPEEMLIRFEELEMEEILNSSEYSEDGGKDSDSF